MFLSPSFEKLLQFHILRIFVSMSYIQIEGCGYEYKV